MTNNPMPSWLQHRPSPTNQVGRIEHLINQKGTRHPKTLKLFVKIIRNVNARQLRKIHRVLANGNQHSQELFDVSSNTSKLLHEILEWLDTTVSAVPLTLSAKNILKRVQKTSDIVSPGVETKTIGQLGTDDNGSISELPLTSSRTCPFLCLLEAISDIINMDFDAQNNAIRATYKSYGDDAGEDDLNDLDDTLDILDGINRIQQCREIDLSNSSQWNNHVAECSLRRVLQSNVVQRCHAVKSHKPLPPRISQSMRVLIMTNLAQIDSILQQFHEARRYANRALQLAMMVDASASSLAIHDVHKSGLGIDTMESSFRRTEGKSCRQVTTAAVKYSFCAGINVSIPTSRTLLVLSSANQSLHRYQSACTAAEYAVQACLLERQWALRAMGEIRRSKTSISSIDVLQALAKSVTHDSIKHAQESVFIAQIALLHAYLQAGRCYMKTEQLHQAEKYFRTTLLACEWLLDNPRIRASSRYDVISSIFEAGTNNIQQIQQRFSSREIQENSSPAKYYSQSTSSPSNSKQKFKHTPDYDKKPKQMELDDHSPKRSHHDNAPKTTNNAQRMNRTSSTSKLKFSASLTRLSTSFSPETETLRHASHENAEIQTTSHADAEINVTPHAGNKTRQTSRTSDGTRQTPRSRDHTRQTPRTVDGTRQTPRTVDDARQTPHTRDDTRQTPHTRDDTRQTPRTRDETRHALPTLDETRLTPRMKMTYKYSPQSPTLQFANSTVSTRNSTSAKSRNLHTRPYSALQTPRGQLQRLLVLRNRKAGAIHSSFRFPSVSPSSSGSYRYSSFTSRSYFSPDTLAQLQRPYRRMIASEHNVRRKLSKQASRKFEDTEDELQDQYPVVDRGLLASTWKDQLDVTSDSKRDNESKYEFTDDELVRTPSPSTHEIFGYMTPCNQNLHKSQQLQDLIAQRESKSYKGHSDPQHARHRTLRARTGLDELVRTLSPRRPQTKLSNSDYLARKPPVAGSLSFKSPNFQTAHNVQGHHARELDSGSKSDRDSDANTKPLGPSNQWAKMALVTAMVKKWRRGQTKGYEIPDPEVEAFMRGEPGQQSPGFRQQGYPLDTPLSARSNTSIDGHSSAASVQSIEAGISSSTYQAARKMSRSVLESNPYWTKSETLQRISHRRSSLPSHSINQISTSEQIPTRPTNMPRSVSVNTSLPPTGRQISDMTGNVARQSTVKPKVSVNQEVGHVGSTSGYTTTSQQPDSMSQSQRNVSPTPALKKNKSSSHRRVAFSPETIAATEMSNTPQNTGVPFQSHPEASPDELEFNDQSSLSEHDEDIATALNLSVSRDHYIDIEETQTNSSHQHESRHHQRRASMPAIYATNSSSHQQTTGKAQSYPDVPDQEESLQISEEYTDATQRNTVLNTSSVAGGIQQHTNHGAMPQKGKVSIPSQNSRKPTHTRSVSMGATPHLKARRASILDEFLLSPTAGSSKNRKRNTKAKQGKSKGISSASPSDQGPKKTELGPDETELGPDETELQDDIQRSVHTESEGSDLADSASDDSLNLEEFEPVLPFNLAINPVTEADDMTTSPSSTYIRSNISSVSNTPTNAAASSVVSSQEATNQTSQHTTKVVSQKSRHSSRRLSIISSGPFGSQRSISQRSMVSTASTPAASRVRRRLFVNQTIRSFVKLKLQKQSPSQFKSRTEELFEVLFAATTIMRLFCLLERFAKRSLQKT